MGHPAPRSRSGYKWVGEKNSVGQILIHLLTEQPSLEGTSKDHLVQVSMGEGTWMRSSSTCPIPSWEPLVRFCWLIVHTIKIFLLIPRWDLSHWCPFLLLSWKWILMNRETLFFLSHSLSTGILWEVFLSFLFSMGDITPSIFLHRIGSPALWSSFPPFELFCQFSWMPNFCVGLHFLQKNYFNFALWVSLYQSEPPLLISQDHFEC